MSAIKGRRRQTPIPRADQRLLSGWVPSDVHAKAALAADAAGISIARYLRALVERDELDQNGRPVWSPANDTDQQEFDLKTA